MKKVKLEPVRTITDKKFRIPDIKDTSDEPKTIETDELTKLLELLVLSLPRQKLTMDDSIHGSRLYEQLRAAKDGIIPIEEAEHDWIKKTVREYAPQIFGVNAVKIQDALDNFERKHEPAEKRVKEEADAT